MCIFICQSCIQFDIISFTGDGDLSTEDEDDVDWDTVPNLSQANLEKMLRDSVKLVATSPRKAQRVAHLNRLVQIWFKKKSLPTSVETGGDSQEVVDDRTALQLQEIFLW